MNQWNEIILRVLRELHTICHDNDIRYFACGGTAIGAVRHGGIIPWDDDIDVTMPRPDYDRFIEVCRHRDMGDFELILPEKKANYPLPFIKLCDRRTTLIEHDNTPCVIGLYVDIFPLDGTSSNIEEAAMLKRRYVRLWNKLEAISTRSSFTEHIALLARPHEWGRFAVKTMAFFCRSTVRSLLLKKLDAISRKYDYETSDTVIIYGGSYGEREIMPKTFCQGECIEMPFDSITILMPSGYKDYLTRIYGDYMQLPPEEKRVSHHYHAVLDLTKRLSDADAIALLPR